MVVVSEDRNADVVEIRLLMKDACSSLAGSGPCIALRRSLVLTKSNQVDSFNLNYSPT